MGIVYLDPVPANYSANYSIIKLTIIIVGIAMQEYSVISQQ